MKRLLVIMLCLLCVGMPAWAAEIGVIVNGTAVSFADQTPTIVQDRTLIPLRSVFDAMGCYVSWEDSCAYVMQGTTEEVTILSVRNNEEKMEKTVFTRDNSGTLCQIKTSVILDVPAQIVNDRMMIPLRAVSESLGAEVDWKDSSKTVLISFDDHAVVQADESAAEEYRKLAHIQVSTLGEATEVLRRLADGENFLELMALYSQDPGITDAPEGYLFALSELTIAQRNAVETLAVGSYTTSPLVDDGYHLFYRLELDEEDREQVLSAVRLASLLQQL